MSRLSVLAIIAALMSGCGEAGSLQTWQTRSTADLGRAKATPAEPRPGDTVEFESLIFTPTDATLGGVSYGFLACPQTPVILAAGPDPSILDALSTQFETLSDDDLAELLERSLQWVETFPACLTSLYLNHLNLLTRQASLASNLTLCWVGKPQRMRWMA